MRFFRIERAALLLPLVLDWLTAKPVMGDGDLSKVKHIIVVMQENHSFDNYFGVLAYAAASPTTTALGAAGQTTTLASTGSPAKRQRWKSELLQLEPGRQRSLVFSFHDPKAVRGAGPKSWVVRDARGPQGGSFRLFSATRRIPIPSSSAVSRASGRSTRTAGLPSVSFIDPNFGLAGRKFENDEHRQQISSAGRRLFPR